MTGKPLASPNTGLWPMGERVSQAPAGTADLLDLLDLTLDALGAVPPSKSLDEAVSYICEARKIIGTGGTS